MKSIILRRNNLSNSPKKMKVVASVFNGKSVEYSLLILSNSINQNKSARLLEESIRSAFNQLKGSFKEQFSPSKSFVFLSVNKGKTMQRKVFPRAKGRADFIRKNSCNLIVSVKSLGENNV